MNEYQAQNELAAFTRARNHEWTIPNVHLYSWESDLLSVTRAGLIHDFEIKVTRADFRRELKQYETGNDYVNCKRRRHVAMTNGASKCPNYFWFAYPAGMIGVEDVPDFAGAIEVSDSPKKILYPIVRREAPRLHGNKLTDRQRDYIVRGLAYRYWDMRRQRDRDRIVRGGVAA